MTRDVILLASLLLPFGLCILVVFWWAARPPETEDDLEQAYLDDLIARRGTPAWRAGHGAYDQDDVLLK